MNDERKTNSYIIINLALSGIILLIFIYSALFSASKDNHPVPSFYESVTGDPANSSGLSRAFSEIIRGNLDSARAYNEHSIAVFLFFLIQLFQRIGITFVVKKWPHKLAGILIPDVSASVILFLVCFWGLILDMVKIFTSG